MVTYSRLQPCLEKEGDFFLFDLLPNSSITLKSDEAVIIRVSYERKYVFDAKCFEK